MPFKDSLSKLAKSVGEGAAVVAKKSGDVMEVTKLNMSIQSQEDKVKALYSEIGVIIYNKYGNNEPVDEDVTSVCEKIREAEAEITELKSKVLEIKKVKLCSNCSAELPLEAVFCPKCGTKQI